MNTNVCFISCTLRHFVSPGHPGGRRVLRREQAKPAGKAAGGCDIPWRIRERRWVIKAGLEHD